MKFSTPIGQWGEGALFWCSKWTLAIFIGDIVTNSAFTIGDYESLSILSFLTIFSSIQNISLQVLEITKSSLDEKALRMCDAE